MTSPSRNSARSHADPGATPLPKPPMLEPKWREVSSASFAWRTALWLILMAGGVLLASHAQVWSVTVGILVLGVAMAHGVELSHQALHHTGFHSRLSNEIFGVAMGLPMLVSFYEYRINHLKHHALLGTPENQEFFDYGSETWSPMGIALRFLMPRHYASFCSRFIKALLGRSIGDYHVRYQASVQRFYFVAAIAFLCLAATCWLVGSVAPLLIWLTALFLVASPLHAYIEMPEHYGCDELSLDPFKNTRTIKSNWFMTWLTNGNNYHVEHHLWPSVPIQKIRKLHKLCSPQSHYLNTGYLQFYTQAWRDARKLLSR